MTELLTTDQKFILRVANIIVANLANENFGVRELATEIGISTPRLNRKLNAITGKTINQLIREVRLMKALGMLKNESVTVSEVAYKVGFSSPSYFNTCFHEFFGYPPGKVKKDGLEIPGDETLITHFIPEHKQNKTAWQRLAIYKLWFLIILVLVVVFIILVYPKILNRDVSYRPDTSDGRITIAVMPFKNLANDTIWDVWQDGIQMSLINTLTNSEEITVRQAEPINSLLQSKGFTNFGSITPKIAGKISQKLDANFFICGSIAQSGSLLRINAQLIDSETEEIIKSFEIDGNPVEKNIIPIIDSLKVMLTNYLIISKYKIDISPRNKELESNSPEAYRNFAYGNKAVMKGDFSTGLDRYKKAIEIDSTFNAAIIGLLIQDINFELYKDARVLCLKIYKRRNQMSILDKNLTDWIHAMLFETPWEAIYYMRQRLDMDDQMPGVYYLLGMHYNTLHEFEKAIPEFEKAEILYNKYHIKPGFGNYTSRGYACYKTGNHKKEKRIYRKASLAYPDNTTVLFRQAVLALSEGNSDAASKHLEKYIIVCKEKSWPEIRILTGLAEIYSQAEIPDKAEEYYRQAVSLEPENLSSLNNLAYFLINRTEKLDEGMEIINKAMRLSPESYNCLHTMGWGYFKKGMFQEAREILQKSWDLRMMNAIYNHDAYLHLEAAKKERFN